MPRQSFNRIKRVYASGGHVILEVYDKLPTDPDAQTIHIESKVLKVKDAALRAIALNKMALTLPSKDAKVAMDIVNDTIAACKEAQKQLSLPPSAVDDFLRKPAPQEKPPEEPAKG